MLRERFRPAAMLAAIGAMFAGREFQRLGLAPSPHHRMRIGTAGKGHRSRVKAKRRVRNEMAFESRRRNRS